jgi:hypothetical protein
METATNTLVAGCKITNIPEDTEVIGNGAFFGVGTTNNYIPNSVTKIARLAYVAAKFSSIVIPDNVRVIGGGAFIDCQNLKTVTIGSGVEEMGAEPFYDEIDAIASISSPLTSVEFKNPNNWKVYKIDSSWDNSHPDYDMITNPTNPISISSSALSNKSTAATYLSSVNSYGYRYVWARNK